jgi:hypothetical protein
MQQTFASASQTEVYQSRDSSSRKIGKRFALSIGSEDHGEMNDEIVESFSLLPPRNAAKRENRKG